MEGQARWKRGFVPGKFRRDCVIPLYCVVYCLYCTGCSYCTGTLFSTLVLDYIIHSWVALSRPVRLAHSTVMSSKRKWDQAAPEDSKDEPESSAKLAKADDGKNASTAAAAAAAIAAKIAAQYSGAAAGGGAGLLGPKDIHDGEFAQDIDINDVRNRYMLTRGSTQQQVRLPLTPFLFTGASQIFLDHPVRFTKKRVPLSALKAYGTQTVRRLRRRTPPCTSTYPRIQKKCCRMPLTKSMSSSPSTWVLL